MAPKPSFFIAIVLVAVLAIAPSALGAGIQYKRTAARSDLRPQPSNPLIAPATACPNQANSFAPPAAQEQTMRCMTDFARARAGLGPLDDSQQLDLSAEEKGTDVLSCDSFSHTACHRDFAYWMRQSGYVAESCWRVGENLAWGTGAYGTVRSIFQAWMRSPDHRQNILGDYEDLGLNLQTGELGGLSGADVWTAHFGSHCDAATAEN